MTAFLRLRGLALVALPVFACAGPGAPGQRPAPGAGSPSLAITEKAIARAVEAGNASGLELLEQIVNINSGTMNLGGVRAVGALLRAQLDEIGFQTRWIDGASFGRAGHLLAEHPGTGPRVLLIGHLDTVFEPSSPFQRFQPIDAATARGPGIIDMKGGDVIIVQALKALRAVGELDRMTIAVVMNGDEEHPGEPLAAARRALIEAATGAVAALAFEDGSGDPHTAVTARRGASSFTLRSTGTPAHSSQIFQPDVGMGAIYEAARVLDAFRTRLAGQPYLTFSPGVLLGGTAVTLDAPHNQGAASGKTNVVAKDAVVQGDLRALSPQQLESTRATMRGIVARPLPHTTSTIEFQDGYPPMAPTEGNRRLLAMYDLVSRDLGLGPVTAVDPSKAGAADVSFVAGLVSMALDGIGLAGRDDHTDKETADLRMLPELTKRAAVLLYRLSRAADGASKVARVSISSGRVGGTVLTAPLPGSGDAAPEAAGTPWEYQSSGVTARLRGVSAVSDRVAWASGASGTILRTADGGRTWQERAIPGTETLDFRDVDAVDARTAYVLSIGLGEASRIYKTTDAGATWTLQLQNRDPKVFLDAMAFWDARRGLVVGDSVGGHFSVLRTLDGGRSWAAVPAAGLPPALPGEGAFAASGTSVAVQGARQAWIGTGAAGSARVLRTEDGGETWALSATPVPGGPTAGIFSIAFRDARHGVIVGGDYKKETQALSNAALSEDGGATWTVVPPPGLGGFRSAVTYVEGLGFRRVLTVGPSGGDQSRDGERWTALPHKGFHAVGFPRRGTVGWAVGEGGLVARIRVLK